MIYEASGWPLIYEASGWPLIYEASGWPLIYEASGWPPFSLWVVFALSSSEKTGECVESFQPVGGCSLMRLVGGRLLGGLQFYVVSLLLAVHYLFLAGGGSL